MLFSIGISNIEAPANKLGTIKEAICPISCSFDAYRSREVYRDVSSICKTDLTFQLQITNSQNEYVATINKAYDKACSRRKSNNLAVRSPNSS